MSSNIGATSVDLSITGMTCASCASRVEVALSRLPGIDAANVNLATEKATLRAHAAIDIGGAMAAIENAGMRAQRGFLGGEIDVGRIDTRQAR